MSTLKMVDRLLQVGTKLLLQARGFKYLGVLFMSKGRTECEMDWQIGKSSAVMHDAGTVQDHHIEEVAVPESKAFNLQVAEMSFF